MKRLHCLAIQWRKDGGYIAWRIWRKNLLIQLKHKRKNNKYHFATFPHEKITLFGNSGEKRWRLNCLENMEKNQLIKLIWNITWQPFHMKRLRCLAIQWRKDGGYIAWRIWRKNQLIKLIWNITWQPFHMKKYVVWQFTGE